MKHYFTLLFLLLLSVCSLSTRAQNDTLMPFNDTAVTAYVDTSEILDSAQWAMDSILMSQTLEPEIKEEERFDGDDREYAIQYRTFEFYLLLVILILFGAVRLMDPQVYGQLFKKFLNTSLSLRPIKNVLQQIHLSNYILAFLFYIIAGLYLYYILDKWNLHPLFINEQSIGVKMLFYILCVTVTYVIKISFLSLIGNIFDIKKFSSEYIYNVILVQQVLGIILYPFLWMLVFMGESVTKASIVVSVVLFILAFFNRYARSRESIASLLKLNKFHFFIYLCTSEIIPLLIMIKIIVG